MVNVTTSRRQHGNPPITSPKVLKEAGYSPQTHQGQTDSAAQTTELLMKLATISTDGKGKEMLWSDR
jgi:hypothetical protein